MPLEPAGAARLGCKTVGALLARRLLPRCIYASMHVTCSMCVYSQSFSTAPRCCLLRACAHACTCVRARVCACVQENAAKETAKLNKHVRSMAKQIGQLQAQVSSALTDMETCWSSATPCCTSNHDWQGGLGWYDAHAMLAMAGSACMHVWSCSTVQFSEGKHPLQCKRFHPGVGVCTLRAWMDVCIRMHACRWGS